MAKASPIQTAFNAGEISPRLEGRVDLDRYGASAQTLINVVPTVQGPLVKRPGTKFVCEVPDSTKEFRLVPFEYSRTQSYLVGFGDRIAWIFRNGAPVLEDGTSVGINNAVGGVATATITTAANHNLKDGDHVYFSGLDTAGTIAVRLNNRIFPVTVTGATTFTVPQPSNGLTYVASGGDAMQRVYVVVTPYASTELDELTWTQSADVLYLAHPSYPPRKLLRYDHDDWVLTEAQGLQLGRAMAITAITTANPGAVTVSAPHNLATGDKVYLSRIGGMREVNGIDVTVTVTSTTAFTIGIDTTNYHAFIASAGTPYAQEITGQEWPPFFAENTNTNVLVGVTSDSAGDTVSVFATQEIFTSSLVGSYLKIRELPAVIHTPWEASNSLDNNSTDGDTRKAAMDVGDFCQYEGNVYELIDKAGLSKTGRTPPTHTVPGEQQLDHKWTWEYAHSGAGFIEITAYVNARQLTGRVIRRMPQSVSCPQVTDAIRSVLTTQENVPVGGATSLDTTANHDYQTGDKIFVYGITGAVELNERSFWVTRLSATRIRLWTDAAMTVDVDPATVSAYVAGGTLFPVYAAQTPGGDFNATHRYSFSAWSPVFGYPRTTVFYEDRLWWASTTQQPQTMWASETASYESHNQTPAETTALEFTLNSQDMNAIEWITASDSLVIGTQGGIFIGSGADTGKAIGLENILKTIPVYPNGVRAATPVLRVDGIVIFVQRGGRKVRELVYEDASRAYRAPDIAEAADHLVTGGIRTMAFHSEPWRLIWTVLENGLLRTCTYDRQEEVVAWSEQIIGGTSVTAESVATVPNQNGNEDETWVVVRRTINGSPKRYVERFEREWTDSDVLADAYFVDCGLTYSGGAISTVTGLDHLEAATVAVFADGTRRNDATVTNGAITISGAAAAKIHVGYVVDALFISSRFEAGSQDGTSQGKVKRSRDVILRLYRTGTGLYYGQGDYIPANLDLVPMTADQDPAGAAQTLLTGDTRELVLPLGHDRRGNIIVRHADPTPFTLLAIMPHVEVEDRL